MQAGSNDNADSQRLFIAIPCPLTAPIRAAHDELRAALSPDAGLRLADPATLHLTLKFLGAVSTAQQAVLRTALVQLLQDQPAFSVRIRGVGSFHGVLWLDLAAEPQLHMLAARLNDGLAPYGFAPEAKPFQPHVTLARRNRNSRFDGNAWLQQQQATDWGTLDVNHVALYCSQTRPDQARYAILQTFALS